MHLSDKIFIGFVKSTAPLRALAKPSLTCLVLLVNEMLKISAMSAICLCASARLVVPKKNIYNIFIYNVKKGWLCLRRWRGRVRGHLLTFARALE